MSRNSICRDHFQRHSAAALGAAVEHGAPDPAAASQYELMLHKLAEDKRRLKDIKAVERKIAVKAELLPEYLPWVEGALEAGSGRQDDVLMTVFVWAIDIGQFPLALRICAYAIEHGLTMPDQYQRDVPSVMAEELADGAIKAIEAEQTADLASIEQTLALVAGQDMHDPILAKLYKAYGYALRQAGRLVEAQQALQRALQLFDKVGVKKDIERLETAIKNSPPAEQAEKSADSGGG